MAKKHKKAGQRGKGRRRRRSSNLPWLMMVLTLAVAAGVLFFMQPGNSILGTMGLNAVPTPEPTPEITAEPTPTPVPTSEPTPEPTPVVLDYPYYVVVDRGAQVVTVYTLDANGEYRLPVRQMICTTGAEGTLPVDGTYRIDGEQKRWLTTVSEPRTYTQYAMRINAKLFFQSLPYTENAANALDAGAYAQLGQSASSGGVWLTCGDAKWIYDNIPSGTMVTFTTGTRNEELLSSLAPPALTGGKWDPTDPDVLNTDYVAEYEQLKPEVTPWLAVTPKPTETLIPMG